MSKETPNRLTLQPPETVISPPSPIDPSIQSPTIFDSPVDSPTTAFHGDAETKGEGSGSSSSQRQSSTPRNDRSPARASKPSLSSSSSYSSPVDTKQLTSSPQKEPSMLLSTPSPSHTSRPSSPTMSGPPSRSASPSSPHYRPRDSHHRRTSSTHRVRETLRGEQKSTDDGQRMVNQYRIGKSLGKGGYAKVELAMDVGTGVEYAIKEFSKSRLHLQVLQEKHRRNTRRRSKMEPLSPMTDEADDDRTDGTGPWGNQKTKAMEDDPLGLIRREVAVMKKLDHPHLVHLYEAISVPRADALFLVLEYMPGGVLMDIKMGEDANDAKPPFSQDQAREYFRQLILGLEYLHENGVIHRDVKPDNVLLSADREVLKLCDFGVSEMFVSQGDDRVKRSGGSPAFLSPESFTMQTHEVHGKAVDNWALGITLYCMLVGTLPFNRVNPLELMEAVQNDDPPKHEDWDESLQGLVSGMLDKDPVKRLTMAEIRENDWVTAKGEEPMISKEENLYDLGQHVEEPTQDEIHRAINSLRSIFTVVRAMQKFKRLGRHGSSSLSFSTTNSSVGGPQRWPPDMSHNPSLASGSMDSYAGNPQYGTDTTETSYMDSDDHVRSASPACMDSETEGTQSKPQDEGTQSKPQDEDTKAKGDAGDEEKSQDTGTKREGKSVDTLKKPQPIKTDVDDEKNGEGDDLQLVDSPTSDDEMPDPS